MDLRECFLGSDAIRGNDAIHKHRVSGSNTWASTAVAIGCSQHNSVLILASNSLVSTTYALNSAVNLRQSVI
jgi:hypothetical protein